MPVDFSNATSKKVHAFLMDASNPKLKVRKTLETGSRPAVSKLLEGYGVVVSPDELPLKGDRRIPNDLQCRLLITMFMLDDEEYAVAKYDYNPSSLAPLMLVIGHAMPLHATVDGEVAAAG